MGIAFALFCNVIAVRFKRRNGVYPWGLHRLVWALIGFLVGIIGLVLILIARKTTQVPVSQPPSGHAYRFDATTAAAASQWAPPAWDNPPAPGPPVARRAPPPQPPPRVVRTVQPTFPPPQDPPAGYSPDAAPSGAPPDWPPLPPQGTAPAWLPDPTGRDGYRFFNGFRWTPWVHTRGGASVHHL